MEPQSAAADLIRDAEHPQIIATILVHLQTQSGRRYSGALFDERLRHDVMPCIATFAAYGGAGGVDRSAECLLDGQNLKRSKCGRRKNRGVHQPDKRSRRSGYLPPRKFDGELAQKINTVFVQNGRMWTIATSSAAGKWIPNRC